MRKTLSDLIIRRLEPSDTTYRIWDEKQAGLCVEVTPNGCRTFRVVYRNRAGRQRWFTVGKYTAVGLAGARDIAKTILAKVVLGEDPHADRMAERRASKEGDTLREVHGRYLERHAKRHNKSWKQGAALITRYVLPTLGDKKLREVGRGQVRKLFDDLTEGGAPVLANQVLAALSAVLTWAVKRDQLTANPCTGIERNSTQSGERFLSDEEVKLVWPAFADLGLYECCALRLVLLLGQRPGEVCAMRWQDIDVGNAVWSLPGKPTGDWPGTKNGRDHQVPLAQAALDILTSEATVGPAQAEGPVFPGVRGAPSISIPSVVAVWKGLGIPRFRPHDLRATAATGMDALGIARETISRVLNHVEGGVTAGYVRHDAMQAKRAALDAWAAHLAAVVEGRKADDGKVASLGKARKAKRAAA